MSLDPTVLDASAINDAGEFEMLLFDDVNWDNAEDHQQQLQAKIAAYLDAAANKPESKSRNVRITMVAMYEPEADGKQFISNLRALVEGAGIAFKYELKPVADEEW